jgi:hypothetical protein
MVFAGWWLKTIKNEALTHWKVWYSDMFVIEMSVIQILPPTMPLQINADKDKKFKFALDIYRSANWFKRLL